MPRRNAREIATTRGEERDGNDERAGRRGGGRGGEVGNAAPGMNGAADTEDADEAEGDAEGDAYDYGHADRAFLQAFLARSVMTGDEVRKLLSEI